MKKTFFIFFLLLCRLSAYASPPPPLPVTTLNKEAAQQMKKSKTYWIEVQVPQRKLVLAKGDHIIRTFPVAVGQPTYPSPAGWRKINQVVWNPWWYPPKTSDWVEDATPIEPRMPTNPLGEIKMPLGGGYLIHGTKAVDSIGSWASHGCIRMLFEDVFGVVQLLLTEYSKASAIDEMEKANKTPHVEFATRLNSEVPVLFTYDTVKVHDKFITISPDLYNKEPDRVAHVIEVMIPYVDKKREPNPNKIKSILKMFKNQTIHVPLDRLTSSVSSSKKEDKSEKTDDQASQ